MMKLIEEEYKTKYIICTLLLYFIILYIQHHHIYNPSIYKRKE